MHVLSRVGFCNVVILYSNVYATFLFNLFLLLAGNFFRSVNAAIIIYYPICLLLSLSQASSKFLRYIKEKGKKKDIEI
jgi:hypothetical protein